MVAGSDASAHAGFGTLFWIATLTSQFKFLCLELTPETKKDLKMFVC
jgi:hypothetical protein